MTLLDLPPNALPDLDLGRRFILTSAVPGDVFQCGVTGSHNYGFSSPDSDIDLKGIYIAPTRAFLGLRRPGDSVERLTEFEGTECDLTLTELGRALALLLSGNGNILERILSPFQLYSSPEFAELQALARGAVSRRFVRHYQGYFRGMCREHERTSPPRAKALLYAYRVALTGVHLLRTGETQANLRILAPLYGYDDALSLIRIKTEGLEKGAVSPEIDALHRATWDRLERDLQAALEHSPLPADPPNEAACEAWLVDLRRLRL